MGRGRIMVLHLSVDRLRRFLSGNDSCRFSDWATVRTVMVRHSARRQSIGSRDVLHICHHVVLFSGEQPNASIRRGLMAFWGTLILWRRSRGRVLATRTYARPTPVPA